jgi:phenylpropionate dioxygenase-like ring-hydroxylating dioxygenase large terminal subunit
MIPNQWYAVLESSEVPRGRPVGATRLGERLVFFREADGTVACLRDACIHRGASLSAGQVCDGHVQCPFHGFRYDHTGRCTRIPAHGAAADVPERFRARAFPARDAHGFVWVYNGQPAEGAELPPIPFFPDLAIGWAYDTFSDPWPVHYSRAVENQLDVVHLPFVHRTTIGRGGRTVVDGPIVEWLTDTHLRFYVFNRLDDGTPAKPAAQCDKANAAVYLEFLFPNLWQNVLGDKFRVMAAFVPVDEENTVVYIRTYQKVVRAPGLRHLFFALATPANRLILGQDKRVVVTQRPKMTQDKMGELLIAGDRPIAEYRRKRQALIDAAASPR